MISETDLDTTHRIDGFVSGCGRLAIGFGTWVLLGWLLHVEIIKQIIPGQVAVKANTAACFLMVGFALEVLRRQPSNPHYLAMIAKLAATLASLLGVLSFLEFVFGWDLGIDQLLFTAGPEDFPGSARIGLMSPLAGLGFGGLGICLLLIDRDSLVIRRVRMGIACGTAIISLFGVLDFVLEPVATHTFISPITALVLFLMSLSLILVRTGEGWMTLLTSASTEGRITRRLVLASIVTPIVIGWLRWQGQVLGLFSDWAGVALMTVFTIGAMLLFAVWVGKWMSRAEEEHLHRVEAVQRLSSIIKDSNDAIITKSVEGTITSWNPGAEALYGYTEEEVLGKAVSILVPPERHAEFDNLLARVQHGDTIHPFETLRVHKDGRILDVSLSISPIKNKLGRLIGLSAISRDITERKRAEKEIELSRERLSFALKAGHSGSFDWDLATNVVLWSEEAEALYGVPVGDLGPTYDAWEKLVFPADLPAARQGIAEALESGEFAGEWRIVPGASGALRWIEARGKVLFDEHGKPVRMLGINVDVTRRKLAEEALRELKEQLEVKVEERTRELTNTLQELETFTYSVSHDLRAPLRHIAGYAQILLDSYGAQLSPEALEYATKMQTGAKRMGMLIDDLLNLSRCGRTNLNPEITGLRSVVDEVIRESSTETVGRKIEWKIGKLPFVECDAALMKQVFANLISNALKFSRQRSVAIIEIGETMVDGAPAIFVRDNGVGFSMKYADKLFGIFQRLHRSQDFEGTGVGLATVQRIVKKHGGRAWAQAELDHGATFYFTLPRGDSSEPQPAEAELTATTR